MTTKSRNCPQCGSAMTESFENYGPFCYRRTSPDNLMANRYVTLYHLQIHKCSCEELTVSIPKIEKLHELLDEHPNAKVLTYEKELGEWRIIA